MDHECKVVKLHESPDLIKEAAQLLNDEWPRSLEARCDVIGQSSDNLPCSFALLKVSTDGNVPTVVGFSRLSKVLKLPKSVLVESVVVDKTLRGCGLGKMIMKHTEDFAQKQGYVTIHLSTRDKQSFYEHLGYSLSSPVSPETKVSKYFAKLQIKEADDHDAVKEANYSGTEEKAKPSQCVMPPSTAFSTPPQPSSVTSSPSIPPIPIQQPLPIPPPLPPPPTVEAPMNLISSPLYKNYVWMKKELYSHDSTV